MSLNTHVIYCCIPHRHSSVQDFNIWIMEETDLLISLIVLQRRASFPSELYNETAAVVNFRLRNNEVCFSVFWCHADLSVDTSISEKYTFSIFRTEDGDSAQPLSPHPFQFITQKRKHSGYQMVAVLGSLFVYFVFIHWRQLRKIRTPQTICRFDGDNFTQLTHHVMEKDWNAWRSVRS